MGEGQQQIEKISFIVDIPLEVVGDKDVHADIPKELRITRPLLAYIAQALAGQGLELKHLKIKEEHKQDLKEMADANVEESADTFSIRF